jgi:hypothetical protein
VRRASKTGSRVAATYWPITRTDTLSQRTAVAMYATYCAHIAALGWASSRRILPLRLPLRSRRIVGAASAVVGGGIARPCPGGTNVAITPQATGAAFQCGP